MRKSYMITLAALALAFTPSAGAAEYPLAKRSELSKYSGLWHAVRKAGGGQGRNIRRWGVRVGKRTRPASAREIAASIRQLRALRHPLLVPVPPAREPAGIASPGAGGVLSAIAACESGGNPRAIGGGGAFRGKYQFTFSTWASVGGTGDPAAASEAEQDRRAAILYSRAGPSPWPVCGS